MKPQSFYHLLQIFLITTFLFHVATEKLLSQCNVLFEFPGVTTWTVPAGVSSVTIKAIGADGGDRALNSLDNGRGGTGAVMVATFDVTPGDVLDLHVGSRGRFFHFAGAGGGGSAVILNKSQVLIVAGGGGGASRNCAGSGGRASINSVPGGGASSPLAGGGGGFNADGAGAYGGKKATLTTRGGTHFGGGGGWAGGGGTESEYNGGGGGGFRGGNAGMNDLGTCMAEGGDSFINTGVNNGTIVSNTPGAVGQGNNNSGRIFLTYENTLDLNISCQDHTVEINEYGQGRIVPEDVTEFMEGHCNAILTQYIFECWQQGETQVYVTAFDASGNEQTCVSNVTAVDNIPPWVVCPEDMIVENTPGSCEATFTVPKPDSGDNCGGVTSKFRYRPVDESGNDIAGLDWTEWKTNRSLTLALGHYKIEWQFVDGAGNSQECEFLVEIEDAEPPVPVCLNPTVEFSGEQQILLEVSDLFDADNSTDNCGDVYLISQSITEVNCSQIGNSIPFTLVVEDNYGHTAECSSTVMVSGLPCGYSADPDGIDCTGGNQADYDPDTGTYTITSEGCYDPSYYSTTDSHGFIGRELCGDGEIIAQVTQVNGNGFAGIAMREDLSPGSKMIQLGIDGVFLTKRKMRMSTGATAFQHQFQTQGKNWLRLVRSGNQFSAYHSLDGINWEIVVMVNIAMNNCLQVGMYTENKTANGAVTGVFENMTITSGIAPLVAPDAPQLDVANNPALSTGLHVYPNPAKGEAWIEFDQPNNEEAILQVYNNLGQLTHQQSTNTMGEQRIRLNVEDWHGGMYLIQVKTKGQPTLSQKLIVSD